MKAACRLPALTPCGVPPMRTPQPFPVVRPGAVLGLFLLAAAARAGEDIDVSPSRVELEGNFARAQLLVAARAAGGPADGRSADLTHRAAYVSSRPAVVTVGPAGVVLARGNGEA